MGKYEGLTRQDLEKFPDEVNNVFEEMLEVKLKGEGLTRKDLEDAQKQVDSVLNKMLDVKLHSEGLTRADLDATLEEVKSTLFKKSEEDDGSLLESSSRGSAIALGETAESWG